MLYLCGLSSRKGVTSKYSLSPLMLCVCVYFQVSVGGCHIPGSMLFVILQNSEHQEEVMTDPYDCWSAFTFTRLIPEDEHLLISCDMSIYLGVPLVYFDVIVGGM